MKSVAKLLTVTLLGAASFTLAQVNLPNPQAPGMSMESAVRIVATSDLMVDLSIKRWLRQHYPGWDAEPHEIQEIGMERPWPRPDADLFKAFAVDLHQNRLPGGRNGADRQPPVVKSAIDGRKHAALGQPKQHHHYRDDSTQPDQELHRHLPAQGLCHMAADDGLTGEAADWPGTARRDTAFYR